MRFDFIMEVIPRCVGKAAEGGIVYNHCAASPANRHSKASQSAAVSYRRGQLRITTPECSFEPQLRSVGEFKLLCVALGKDRDGTAAERADDSVRENMAVASAAYIETVFGRTCRGSIFGPGIMPRYFDRLALARFHSDLESSPIERATWRGSNLDHALALAFLCELKSTMMAIGIISRTPQQRVGRPGAASFAHVRIVAARAKSPQVGPCQPTRK